jgi:nitrate/TMAO reductase-like tetraheme cytochrome c subunit
MRALLGLLLAALGVWLVVALFRPPAPVRELGPFTSSAQCAECHAGVYREWQASWHAQAWTDPEVRKLSNDFANADCIDCHAPRPIFETGLSSRVLPRSTRRVEGVDCIACHLLPDGRIAGTVDAPESPCRAVAQRELLAPEFCAGCHDQHGTVQQWRATRFAVPGPGFKSCVDCHMPLRGGDPGAGRDHGMHGGHDLELVRSAVELTGRAEGGRFLVEVANVAAGHNYPTDERSRASDVFWRPLGAPGEAWHHLHRFRNPYRHEVGLLNTELPAGETQRLWIDDPGAAAGVEVILVYKLSPYYADPERPDPEREAALVHRIELVP